MQVDEYEDNHRKNACNDVKDRAEFYFDYDVFSEEVPDENRVQGETDECCNRCTFNSNFRNKNDVEKDV